MSCDEISRLMGKKRDNDYETFSLKDNYQAQSDMKERENDDLV